METGSRVDQILAHAVQQQVAEQRAWREAMEAMAFRVEALEVALAEFRAEVAEVVEASARAGVAEGLDAVALQLRRQVSDLGRLIVNDMGRLPQIVQDAVARGPSSASSASTDSSAAPPATASTSVAPTSVEGGRTEARRREGGDDLEGPLNLLPHR